VNKLIRELSGVQCACGAVKKSNQPFCVSCHAALSPGQRKALFRRVGEGYEEAYASAIHSLRELGRMDG
jgi:hypothetical protein